MKRLVAVLLSLCVFMTACSTGNMEKSADLMADITPQEIEVKADRRTTDAAVNFSAELFSKTAAAGENILISPVSVLYALAMVANGAEDATLQQIERAVGADINSLNNWLAWYMQFIEGHEVSLTNSIWYREGTVPGKDFLQTNADFFRASVYSAPFDSSTVKDINSFVKQNTNGMIDKIIEKIEPETVMMLINAIAFEAQWHEKYKEKQISDGIFHAYDGTEQDASYMHSTESVYLSDENTAGFIKYYRDGDYAFIALLPDENTDIAEYIHSLTGEKLNNLIKNRRGTQVETVIPQFENEYSVEMTDILKNMGVERLFSPDDADLHQMAETDYSLFVSNIVHRTRISVDKQGTKAAAVTLVTADEATAEKPMIPYICLDRPFVYMIVHTHFNVPLFIGTVMNME